MVWQRYAFGAKRQRLLYAFVFVWQYRATGVSFYARMARLEHPACTDRSRSVFEDSAP